MKTLAFKLSDLKIEYTLPKLDAPPEVQAAIDELFRSRVAELEAEMLKQITEPRLTALKWTEGGGFETVYLDEPESPRCTCGIHALWHRSDCPLFPVTS